MATEAFTVACITITLTQLAVIATSIYLHRGLAHRALVVHPVADVLFRTVLWLTTGQGRQEWVAVHRKHHTFTDRPGDPHSPRLLGLWRVQLLNAYYYAREARNPDTLRRFAPDIPPDRWDRMLFSWGWLGPAIGIGLLCSVLGLVPGLVVGLGHAILYVLVFAPLINGLGHWRGQQSFANSAYNWRLLAWVTGGEALHNNHHAHPRAPKFSMRWLEFDPSWLVIRALVLARLIAIAGPSIAPPRESEVATPAS